MTTDGETSQVLISGIFSTSPCLPTNYFAGVAAPAHVCFAGVVLPVSLLRWLSSGIYVDKPIAGVVWPVSLRQNLLGFGFKQQQQHIVERRLIGVYLSLGFDS